MRSSVLAEASLAMPVAVELVMAWISLATRHLASWSMRGQSERAWSAASQSSLSPAPPEASSSSGGWISGNAATNCARSIPGMLSRDRRLCLSFPAPFFFHTLALGRMPWAPALAYASPTVEKMSSAKERKSCAEETKRGRRPSSAAALSVATRFSCCLHQWHMAFRLVTSPPCRPAVQVGGSGGNVVVWHVAQSTSLRSSRRYRAMEKYIILVKNGNLMLNGTWFACSMLAMRTCVPMS
mmetsp:Transcript_4768/g.14148  ORF Transcript_4768/g.14148 Transcript_4768/m.14148 type:complete len:240 (+) Transcript_4768:913-1632(+)